MVRLGGAAGVPRYGEGEGVVQLARVQKILSLRIDHAISDLILVGGFGPDFTPAGCAKQVTCSDRGGHR